MRIHLASIQPPQDGGRVELPFAGELDLSGLRRFGECPFSDPVRVEGEAVLQHGAWTVHYTAAARLRETCSRCLGPAERVLEIEESHPVSLEDRDEVPAETIPAPDGVLDLAELVGADLSLSLEGVALCDESCKGLCPICGANRNLTVCGCGEEKPTDPRFDALKKLIEQGSDQ